MDLSILIMIKIKIFLNKQLNIWLDLNVSIDLFFEQFNLVLLAKVAEVAVFCLFMLYKCAKLNNNKW